MTVRQLPAAFCGREDRFLLSAGGSFLCHLLYAAYHGIRGVCTLSLWLIAMCVFYGLLATMRFSVIFCTHKRRNHPQAAAYPLRRLTGALLVGMSIVLIGLQYISLTRHIAAKYDEILMISIAAYTFAKIAMTIRQAVRARRRTALPQHTLQQIRYAETAVSLATLQRSMLASFGGAQAWRSPVPDALTGGVVCLFVLCLGISMLLPSNGKESVS